MRTLLLTVLLASAAAAERPRIAVHPLVVSGIDSRKDRDELLDVFPLLVKGAGDVDVVSSEQVEQVLNKLPQLSCTGEGAERCLGQVAEKTQAQYALKVELERALKRGEWRLSALLVRPDGVVETRPEIATFAEVKGTRFADLAGTEITKMLTRLKLGQLRLAAKPVEPPPVEKPAETPLPPPLQVVQEPPQSQGGGLRAVAYVAGGLGVAGLASGVVFSVLANSDATAVKSSLVQVNGKPIGIPSSSKALAQRIDTESTGALACYIGGGVFLAAAVVMFGLSAEDSSTAVLLPLKDGGAFVFTWRF
jgi:hypothetical protein